MANIVHEIIDGEVVVANINNGNYYNISGLGTNIWEFLQLGAGYDDIIKTITAHYPNVDGAQISSEINNFISELQKEELIPHISSASAQCAEAITKLPPTFVVPKFEKFTDMQALLLLDPIHEVDVSGWPHEKK